MTELLYQTDAYLPEAAARVVALDGRGIELDQTVFYPQGGGQPGDSGTLEFGAAQVSVTTAAYSKDRQRVLHMVAEGSDLPAVGALLTARIDWPVRFARMRVHTALHLLTAVLPFPVTGGAIGDGDGRLDFDIPDAKIDRGEVQARLQELIERDAAVTTRWITDELLLDNPGLVKTMSVRPPMGTGRVRLVAIGDIDLQPCGGTHVARTAEIGRIAVTGIENKGKQNRRVRIALA
jgi:misacylated tRNA(Ala) deacylase